MEASHSAIDALLQSKRAEGEVDSTADFTIDHLKARQKLTENQLPQPGLWLVKLVQAAVAAQADSIQINFGKRKVEVLFPLAQLPWKPERVLSELLSGALPKESALLHLFAGLRGSIFEDTILAEWSMCGDGKRFRVRFDSEGTHITEESCDDKAAFYLSTSRPPRWPGFKKAAAMPVKHLLRRTAEEYMAIQNYAWACPIPLKLDGRVLETRYRPSPLLGEERFLELSQQMTQTSSLGTLPVALAVREIPGPLPLSINWHRVPSDARLLHHDEQAISLKKLVYLGETWLTWSAKPGQEVGGYLLLLFSNEMESRIEFLCDGAVVDTYPIQWRSKPFKVLGIEAKQNAFKVGVRVIYRVSSEDLDLSHFKVRNAEEKAREFMPQIREAIRETAAFCLENGKDFRHRFGPRPRHGLQKVTATAISTFVRIHPGFALMQKYGFQNDLKSLLKSLGREE